MPTNSKITNRGDGLWETVYMIRQQYSSAFCNKRKRKKRNQRRCL